MTSLTWAASPNGSGSKSLRPSLRIPICSCTIAVFVGGLLRCSTATIDGWKLAYSLMFALPGTPVLRYGDELGMGDDLKLPERNCARTGGFTKSDKPHIPVISGGPYGFEHINAAIQRRHPDSLLNWTERIIRMRKEVPEVGWGDFTVIPSRDPAVLVTRYDWRNNWVLFVHNLDAKPREVTFSAGLEGEHAEHGKLLINLLAEEHSHADKNGKHRLVIEAYGYRWFRVGGLDYLLRRTDIDQPAKQSGA
jgi:maltose alpha-D-glucosyltransferase/alpha-amylase